MTDNEVGKVGSVGSPPRTTCVVPFDKGYSIEFVPYRAIPEEAADGADELKTIRLCLKDKLIAEYEVSSGQFTSEWDFSPREFARYWEAAYEYVRDIYQVHIHKDHRDLGFPDCVALQSAYLIPRFGQLVA